MRPPQLDHGSPPVLVDEAMREIFLRIPPDDPASLARASAVCTAWRGIISDADFGREYRAFHEAPPVLGFLHNYGYPSASPSEFISTTKSFRSPACHHRHDWYALDSRHGLVLFQTHHGGEEIGAFAVCDLVTHDQWSVPAHPGPEWSDVNHHWWQAAVLCARVDRCDHRDCSDGAFLLALVRTNNREVLASVYSSEAGEWSATISTEKRIAHRWINNGYVHSAVIGNKVYLAYDNSNLVVEYDLGAQELAMIKVPLPLRWAVLVGAEDGMLLYATVEESELCLWSVEPGLDAAARRRVIDLEQSSLPRYVFDCWLDVVGFAQGAGVIFLITEGGMFTVELSSGRSKKVHWDTFHKVMPYESFYTGGHGERGRRAVVGATRRSTGLLWLYGENLQ